MLWPGFVHFVSVASGVGLTGRYVKQYVTGPSALFELGKKRNDCYFHRRMHSAQNKGVDLRGGGRVEIEFVAVEKIPSCINGCLCPTGTVFACSVKRFLT